MAPFDAYHQWLGIPPAEQPPDHYRLLGVPLLESDPDVIETAAQRQTVFLRTLQLGPQSELAEQILNEVARARVTLLNVDQKSAYDNQLLQSQRLPADPVPGSARDVWSAEIATLRKTLEQRDRELRQRNEDLEQEKQRAQPARRRLPPARSAGFKLLPSLLTDWTLSNSFKIAFVVILVGFLFLALFSISDRSGVKEPELSVATDLPEEQPKAAEEQPTDREEDSKTTADQPPVDQTLSKPGATVPAVIEPVPPKSSSANLELADPIRKLMTAEQVQLGGPVVNSIDIVLVPIPAGQFQMGSPESELGRVGNETQHLVRITKPFYLSVHEVTQQQYMRVMGINPSRYLGNNKPVEMVSWKDAVAFCDELSKREGEEYRLPTEAQWEYACRAGTTTSHGFEGDATQLGDYAWYRENSENSAHLVGQKKPNPWGLYDMHGNVDEWCQDWMAPYSNNKPLIDPQGSTSGLGRVLRGGSFLNPPRAVRSALRLFLQPGSRDNYGGFRLARIYNLPPNTTIPTVVEPVETEPAAPEVSKDELDVVAAIQEIMTAEQVQLGGPIVNTIGIVLVPIPAGNFMMGSPESEPDRVGNETQHEVKITKPFYLSVHEVTQQQYESVMGDNPSYNRGAKKPVEMVSWNDAVAFCDELSKMEGEEYRLPSEAQWEYACRAGTTTAYSFGGNVTQLRDYAWYSENSGNSAHLVGQKNPNPWGLYDIHGNAWEWCQDWYGPYKSLKGASDPTGPAAGAGHVLRGGSFYARPRSVRSALRFNIQRVSRDVDSGFRVTRTYNSSPAVTGPTVDKPKPPATPPESSPTKLALAAPIKKLMTREQVDLGGPIVNSIDIVLVPIPAGQFTMGSPEAEPGHRSGETQHLVKITKPFYLSAHEVTQQQYEQVMHVRPWEGRDYVKEGPGYPATYVNWEDAVAFCDELSKREGEKYRLPTEAQWEYACRAGTTTACSFEGDASQLGNYAWYRGNAWDNGEKYAHRVGEKLPNAWGLFDMHGNVWEWCQDRYGPYESLQVVSDPTGPASGSRRVLRGGAFAYQPMSVRAANRDNLQPDLRYTNNGFRLTRTYPLSPAVTGPTVDKPKPPATPPKMSRAQLALAAPIKKLMTPEQVDLGGPIVNSIDIVLVPIPAGQFTMGSPESEPDRYSNETQHRVRITKPFYLSAHEVTQQQYESVMQVRPWKDRAQVKEGEDYPATYVNWDDAVAFCGKLSKQEGVEYRLPTESQWEYACRAGTTSAYSFGGDSSQLGNYAWYGGNAWDNGEKYAHRVGEKLPNAWGLFDMHGNVWEWCQDWYGPYESLRVVSDPTGPVSGTTRVLRGGAFYGQPGLVRASNRNNPLILPPGYRNFNDGFRLARTYDLSP